MYLPAIGVATLSGLTLHFLEKRMTPTMTSPRAKLAIEAVTIADAHNNKAWSKSNAPAENKSIATATIEATKPTTIPWHCTNAKLLTIREVHSFLSSILPILACKNSRLKYFKMIYYTYSQKIHLNHT